MYNRISVETYFERGIQRADANIALFRYLSTQAPLAFDLSDLLRGAIVIASSAFDLLHHQLVRSLTYRCIRNGTGNHLVMVPVGIFNADQVEQLAVIDSALQSANCHKSFLMPDKIGQLYTNLVPDFWTKIATVLGYDSANILTARVRELGKWRNRIVHESDINPDLGGISEWPVFVEDVVAGVSDYKRIGLGTVEVSFSE